MHSMTNTRRFVPWADCRIRSQISVISFNPVSQPKENSVPGTLFEIVDGMTTRGIQNSGKLER